MSFLRLTLLLAGVLAALAITTSAQESPLPPIFTAPLPDAPELAQRGAYAVGVTTLTTAGERPLTMEVWYPADRPMPQTSTTLYLDPTVAPDFMFRSRAERDAPPLEGEAAFPLIVISHGLSGTRLQLTYLGDFLASRGAVVAAIDHADPPDLLRAYPRALLHRPADIAEVIDSLLRSGGVNGTIVLHPQIDPDRLGLIGYSFGGYGVLVAGGAGITAALAAHPLLDDDIARYQAGGWPVDPRIRALMVFAPYGMDVPPPLTSFWDAAGLAAIRLPLLIVVGSADEVAGYESGALAIFDRAVNSARCLLVWEGAGHNAPVNPRPAGAGFGAASWDPARLNNIAQHFAAAFFGQHVQEGDYVRYLAFDPANKPWPGFAPGTTEGMQYRCAAP